VVLLARGGGEAAEQMLANMLLKVVLVEPADCLRFAPRPCLACAESVARQVRALRPRVVLAMGADAATMIGQPPLGEWRRWAESDTVLSWHPEEIAADAARKRAAFVTLQEVARRR
jgi:uracil-DNA glycosylase